MNKYYEVKAKYEKTMENGMVKKVKEPYLFDAMSFSEAEARAIEELQPFMKGEFEVTDIKRASYAELFPSDKEAADKWYAVRVAFFTLDERTGKENIEEYVDDFLGVAKDEELIKELNNRGYHVSRSRENEFQPLCKCGNKRFLCDLLGLSYYASNDEIINEIKRNI